MNKMSFQNISKYLLFFIMVILFSGCFGGTPKLPEPGEFKTSYKGISAENLKNSGSVLPCENIEVFNIQENSIDYDEIVVREFREGNVEIGHSSFEGKGVSNPQGGVKTYAEELGACRAYWVVTQLVNPQTQEKSQKDYYGATYFAKVNKNAIFGFHPGQPSNELMQKMNRFYGVEVKAIMPETTAEHSGLKEGDVILFINSSRCTYEEYVTNGCSAKTPWQVLRIYRDGQVIELR